nr:hypothetical protein GCM10025699_06720 [Microbacterium flavescens]
MEPPTITGAHDVSLLTVSYRGDLGLARELCRSVDRYLDPAIEHLLVVSRVDAALFEPLRSDRRRIVIVDDVLPPGTDGSLRRRRSASDDCIAASARCGSLPPVWRADGSCSRSSSWRLPHIAIGR